MIPIIDTKILMYVVKTYQNTYGDKLNLESFGINHWLEKRNLAYCPTKPLKLILNYINNQLAAPELVAFYQKIIENVWLPTIISRLEHCPNKFEEILDAIVHLTNLESPYIDLNVLKNDESVIISRKPILTNVREEGSSDLLSIVFFSSLILVFCGQRPAMTHLKLCTPDSGSEKRNQLIRLLMQSDNPFDSVVNASTRLELTYPKAILELPCLIDPSLFTNKKPPRRPSTLVESITLCLNCYIGTSKFNEDIVADALGVSSRKLQIELKKQGNSFRKIKDSVILENANWLMINSDKSSSEIALILGFSSITQFSRSLKRLTGQAPREYRKSLLSN